MNNSSNDDVDLVIRTRTKDLGGFEVRRALPHGRRKMIGPFIFFDHIGPAEFEPGAGINVRAHPHIGIATITYLFDGEIFHRDSLGYEQRITPGAVNWMTAGSGIAHSERTPPEMLATGSSLHGIQSWVALPIEDEESQPAFDHYPAEQIPKVNIGSVDVRLVTGSGFGLTSPVRTASNTLYAEITMPAGSEFTIPGDCPEQGVYSVSGIIAIGDDDYSPGSLAVLGAGKNIVVRARENSRFMLFGGDSLEGERFIWWNFVSSSEARIEKAKDDWRGGRFADVINETELIPLPES